MPSRVLWRPQELDSRKCEICGASSTSFLVTLFDQPVSVAAEQLDANHEVESFAYCARHEQDSLEKAGHLQSEHDRPSG